MELCDTIKIVREFQAWRRGGDQPMPYPRTTGQALDALCYHAERMERELAEDRDQIAILRSDIKRLEGFAKTYRLRADEAETHRDSARSKLDLIRAMTTNGNPVAALHD